MHVASTTTIQAKFNIHSVMRRVETVRAEPEYFISPLRRRPTVGPGNLFFVFRRMLASHSCCPAFIASCRFWSGLVWRCFGVLNSLSLKYAGILLAQGLTGCVPPWMAPHPL